MWPDQKVFDHIPFLLNKKAPGTGSGACVTLDLCVHV